MKFRLRIISCVLLSTVLLNCMTSSEEFGIGQSKRIFEKNGFCEYICARNPHDEQWTVDIISTKKDESCKKLVTPENIPVTESYNKMYYIINMKEGTKISKLIYFKTNPDELNSKDEIKEFSQEFISKTSMAESTGSTFEKFQVYEMENFFIEKECNFIKNTNIILQSMSVNGTIFQYVLRTNSKYKPNITSPLKYYNDRKKINILRDYFSDFKVNATFLPAIRSMQKDAVTAWLHLEKKIEELMEKYIIPGRWTYYTIQNGFLDYFSKNDKIGRNPTIQLTLTYLMKQVIYENRMIMFLVPNVNIPQYVGYTYIPCIDVCKKFRWIFDLWIVDSQLIICCDPRHLNEFLHKMTILYKETPNYPVIPVSKNGDEISLMWNSNEQTDVPLKREHFFCGSILKHVTVSKSKIYVLTETPQNKQCDVFAQQQILGENTKITGLAFQFDYNDERLELTAVNKDWEFYVGRKLSSDPNIWFIKLSESVSVNGGSSGYKYRILSNHLQKSHSGDYIYPGPYNCKTTNTYPISVSEIFMKENVTKIFVKSNPYKTTQKYLEYIWNTRHMIPVPHISPYDMQFTGFENVNSCTVIPMWTEIYRRYWIMVENMTRKIIQQNNVDAEVYTLEYMPLKFTSDSSSTFRLYEGEGIGNITVHRFIIKMIISPIGSIAFLTINDLFMLMEKGEKQSIFEKEKNDVIDLCKLNCKKIVLDSMNGADKNKLNHCCQVDKKFIAKILNQKLILKKGEQKVLSLKTAKKT